ncbi:type II toxin-antitoxin system RnlB family antitoxin [Dryocola clanedunensis]
MFKIRHFYDNEYPVIVVATSYSNPLSCLKSIEECLMHEAFTGNVLFDLLCSNGMEPNRFAKLFFDGRSFLRNTFSIIAECDLPYRILDRQNEYFSENLSILGESVLSETEISKIIF